MASGAGYGVPCVPRWRRCLPRFSVLGSPGARLVSGALTSLPTRPHSTSLARTRLVCTKTGCSERFMACAAVPCTHHTLALPHTRARLAPLPCLTAAQTHRHTDTQTHSSGRMPACTARALYVPCLTLAQQSMEWHRVAPCERHASGRDDCVCLACASCTCIYTLQPQAYALPYP